MGRSFIAGFCAALLALVLAAPGYAAYPGINGKIAFERQTYGHDGSPAGFEIWTVNPVGADQTPVTSLGDAKNPAWSPDGQRIAFTHAGGVYTIRPDGSDMLHVIDWAPGIDRFAWSPDGERLAASLWTCEVDECRWDLHTLRLDGSDLVDIAPDFFEERNPTWSPDGTEIAFDSSRDSTQRIYKVNADGTGLQSLTDGPTLATSPTWSWANGKIAYATRTLNYCCHQLNLMEGDGSGLTTISTELSLGDPSFSPDGTHIVSHTRWIASTGGASAPLFSYPYGVGVHESVWGAATAPTPVHGTYARPKGATPFVARLVPAYRACTSGNESHGPPLAYPSCSPPQQVSQRVTVGTPDANGRQARAETAMFARLILGNPATYADEADVSVSLHARDIYRASDLGDYSGKLLLRLTARITDRHNTPAEGGDGGATGFGSKSFDLPVQCVATADTTTGATCDLETTLDAIVAGTVTEGARAVWEFAQVRLYDGGPDDDPSTSSSQNNLFQVQGLFVP